MMKEEMKIEGELSKRFKVTLGNEVHGKFDTAAEVRTVVAKRRDRAYQIYDRRRPVEFKNLKD
jgi:hypothetical protein